MPASLSKLASAKPSNPGQRNSGIFIWALHFFLETLDKFWWAASAEIFRMKTRDSSFAKSSFNIPGFLTWQLLFKSVITSLVRNWATHKIRHIKIIKNWPWCAEHSHLRNQWLYRYSFPKISNIFAAIQAPPIKASLTPFRWRCPSDFCSSRPINKLKRWSVLQVRAISFKGYPSPTPETND